MKRLAMLLALMSAFSHAHAQSLGEVARKNRSKSTDAPAKRVWTTDDIASTRSAGMAVSSAGPQELSDSEALRKLRLLGKEELGGAVLKMANAPNVDFPNRKSWEQRLFEAKRAWMDQIDRMMAHKDSSKESQDTELRLTQGAHRNFERIAGDGIEQARAVNDPVLKAHLQYEKRLDFCKQTSGDLLHRCLDAADAFKYQMQREGNW